MDFKNIISEAVTDALHNIDTSKLKKDEFDITDINGASELTGYSKHTIWKLTSRNEIPFIKRPGGRKLFFSKKALETWILGR